MFLMARDSISAVGSGMVKFRKGETQSGMNKQNSQGRRMKEVHSALARSLVFSMPS